MRVFFATDIHGSEVCWRKFLNAAAFYKADMVILGGDVTGKVMIPITTHPGNWQVTVRGQTYKLETQEELDESSARSATPGPTRRSSPPTSCSHLSGRGRGRPEVQPRDDQSLDRWLDMADGKLRGGDIPCILNGGNDDIWEIDDIIEASPCVQFGEAKLLDIGGFSLVSMGWTNPTPWDTFREAPEPELAKKIEAVVGQIPDMGRAIFNFHAPPYGTGLDEAPALDETLRPIHGGCGDEAGRLAGGPRGHTHPSADAVGARPHSREPRRQEDGPDPGHQPGQRLRGWRPARGGAGAEREEGKVTKYLLVNG